MDKRLRSRLFLDIVEFKKYNKTETKGILKERIDYAFFPDVWTADAFKLAVDKTFDLSDIRCGLLMLKKAGKAAEDESSRQIHPKHVEKILKKVDKYSVKGSSELDDETRKILYLIKDSSGASVHNIFKVYSQAGGKVVYRTFYRKVKNLELNKYVDLKKVYQGKKGNTQVVQYRH